MHAAAGILVKGADMGQKYTVDQLLKLSKSPLVCKPEGLPPAEEWMGALPDPNQRSKLAMTRAKTDDGSNQNDGSNRKSGLFEPRHLTRTSSTVPDDIVLGPPKTSFASARTFNKQADQTDKPNKSVAENEDPKSDKYNFREKFFRDKEQAEREPQRRDSRYNDMNGRRGEKGEREDWSSRQKRGFGTDESDRRVKRNGERDTETFGGHDTKEKTENGFEGPRRGLDRDGNKLESRRSGAGRGRHEQSWLKEDTQQDLGEGNDDKSGMRIREWRKDRGEMPLRDKEWTRGHKLEQDPEWMDSTELEDSKQVHTQEDFQRWKERMKAGSTPSGEQPDTRDEGFNVNKQEAGLKVDDGEIFAKDDPVMSLNSMDKFFGLWSAPIQQNETTPSEADEQKKEPAPTKPAKAKASRFTSLFGPPAVEPSIREVELQIPPNPTPPSQKQAFSKPPDDDFQALLQKMLGKGSGSSGLTINPSPALPSAESKASLPQKDHFIPPTSVSSPIRETMVRQDPPPSYRESPPRSRNSGGLESLLGPRSPRENSSNHRQDSELLLRLMQQAQRPAPVTQPQLPSQASGVHTPGILQMPEMMSRPQLISKPKPAPQPPSFYDDPAIANISRHESNESREQLRRRPTNGPPPQGLYDEPSFPPGQPSQHVHQPSNQPRPQQHQPLPYGMPRPPGFDQIPPPWGNPNHQLPPQSQLQHQQQHQPPPLHQQHQGSHIAPPPGIPNPPRTKNPFSAGPQLPFPGPMVQSHDGRPPNYPPRNPNPAGFGLPPGMQPPPGYMQGMNGPPPPGFPPLSGPHEGGMMGMPGGGAQFGANAGNAGGPIPRHLLEMFSQEGRGAMQQHYR